MANYEISDGAISFWEQETDFLISGNVEIPPLSLLDNVRYEYNQKNTLHCTLYWPIWALSDLMNYQFTQTDIDEIVAESVKRGKPINKWRLTQLGVACVCDWRNSKFPEKPVVYYRLDAKTINFTDALKKQHTVVMTYKGNAAYNLDVYDDCIVEWEDFRPSTYGHCVTWIRLDGNGIKDNYAGRKGKNGIDTNQYKIKDLLKLIDNHVFYDMAYLILPQQTKSPEEIKRLMDMKALLNNKITINETLRHMTNDDRYKDVLHEENNISREKLTDIELELKKL